MLFGIRTALSKKLQDSKNVYLRYIYSALLRYIVLNGRWLQEGNDYGGMSLPELQTPTTGSWKICARENFLLSHKAERTAERN